VRRTLAVLVLSLGFPAAALAHVTVFPGYLDAGEQATLTFDAPNERPPHAVATLTVVAPPEVQLRQRAAPSGWKLVVNGSTATWSGGHVGPRQTERFQVGAVTDAAPGAVSFAAVQGYDDGARVRWKIAFTILPSPRPAPKEHLWPALLAGVLGLAAIGAVFAALRRRNRDASLQER
jgi:uncharacterized protein YcnI